MAKGGKRQKKDSKNLKRRTLNEGFAEKDLDDEIDAFHKQRDVIPLDVDRDIGASDEDNEQPVFDFEDGEDDDDDDDDDDIEDDSQFTGLATKIVKQQKFSRQKTGGVEDELHDDAEEEEEKKAVWGRRKNLYYNADNVDYELQSSDEESPAEEEAEVLRLQREKAQFLSMEDFGLEDVDSDESDSCDKPTLEEILVKGKAPTKPHAEKEGEGDVGTAYEEVKKDLNALSKEEQMDVVYSSAPELVGLLSELNDAVYQLESKVNPLLSKVKKGKSFIKGEMHYLEVKQLLLLTYCQAIGFYLLLKAEGHPVRDHPVITRLVEIKNSLDKMKDLDENLPSETEVTLNKDNGIETVAKLVKESAALTSETCTSDHEPALISAKIQEAALPSKTADFTKVGLSEDFEEKQKKRKRQNDQASIQTTEMLKIRASLEEKLKQKGILSSLVPKSDKAQKHLALAVNRRLETLDDFDDELIDKAGGAHGLSNGHAGSLYSSNLSQLGNAKVKKPKVISGDEDFPKRDDIGERRRNHELRVLATAGIEPIDDVAEPVDADVEEGSEIEESEDELYKEAKSQRAARLSMKAAKYSRNPVGPSLPETEAVDGKRHITYQMEKNRGLTRARKKLIKNPRKKYKLKHRKAVVRQQGQVRKIKKPSGPYGGEASGINAGISRSIRFKN